VVIRWKDGFSTAKQLAMAKTGKFDVEVQVQLNIEYILLINV
jgi:hypothetical protein